jgi:hypothetical protein
MKRALELATHVLVAALLGIALVGIGRGVTSRGRFLQHLAADPRLRSRFYRSFIVKSWLIAAFVPMIAIASADLSAADLGWVWPRGDGIDYLLASCVLLMIGTSGLMLRRRMRRGRSVRIRRLGVRIPSVAQDHISGQQKC